jgi:hypothetical protein
MKRSVRIRIAQAKEQAERMAHGMWLRGWYFLSHMNGPAAFPMAYAHRIIAFVVTPAYIVIAYSLYDS